MMPMTQARKVDEGIIGSSVLATADRTSAYGDSSWNIDPVGSKLGSSQLSKSVPCVRMAELVWSRESTREKERPSTFPRCSGSRLSGLTNLLSSSMRDMVKFAEDNCEELTQLEVLAGLAQEGSEGSREAGLKDWCYYGVYYRVYMQGRENSHGQLFKWRITDCDFLKAGTIVTSILPLAVTAPGQKIQAKTVAIIVHKIISICPIATRRQDCRARWGSHSIAGADVSPLSWINPEHIQYVRAHSTPFCQTMFSQRWTGLQVHTFCDIHDRWR